MAQCNTLYDSTQHKAVLSRTLLVTVTGDKHLDLKSRLQRLQSLLETSPQVKSILRISPGEFDNESDVAISQTTLYEDIEEMLDTWIRGRIVDVDFKEGVLKMLGDLLHLTSTVNTSTTEDQDIKSLPEELDQNLANLDQHLSEFYGSRLFDIRISLMQEFSDRISSAAYYNPDTNKVVAQENPVLNRNIRTLKAQFFKNIVSYLQENEATKNDPQVMRLSAELYNAAGVLNIPNYIRATRLFYTLVATQPEFKETLRGLHSDEVSGKTTTDKTAKYTALFEKVDQESGGGLVQYLTNKFNKGEAVTAKSQLYQADHYSKYYAAVKQYIKRNFPNKFNQEIAEIEQAQSGLLDAAKSYTMLNQFDRLTKEVFGNQIKIDSSEFGIETDNKEKYSYHQDTAHERKDWQTSEAIGSERHTSRFTKALLNTIRVQNFKTKEWMRKRVDSTALIVASRNLMNAVLYDKVKFSGQSTVGELFTKLKQAMTDFRSDPVANLQTILDIMFGDQPRTPGGLVTKLSANSTISDYDLSVLYSVYHALFSEDNNNSVYKQAKDLNTGEGKAARDIIEEVAGFVNRNATISYLETVYDFETGAIVTREKKKFFNNQQLYKMLNFLNNHINTKDSDARRAIQDGYNFKQTESDTETVYSVTINGHEFQMRVDSSAKAGALTRNKTSNSGTKVRISAEPDLLERLAKVDLNRFLERDGVPEIGNDIEVTLADMLGFFSDVIGINFRGDNKKTSIAILNTYKQIFQGPMQGFNNFLEPLIQLGIRCAYINSQYLEAEAAQKSLGDYLDDTHDRAYSYYKRNPYSKIFSSRFTEISYQPVAYSDMVLAAWADATSIFNGETSKATTKDKQNNSIPNNSVAKLGSDIHYVLESQAETNMDSLLFVTDPSLVSDTFHDLEVTSMANESRPVKSFSRPELAFHAIFNKFYGRFLGSKDGSVVVQPTTYADKSTFLNYGLKTKIKRNGTTVDLMTLSPADLETHVLQLFGETVGKAAYKSWEHTVNKLVKIADVYRLRNNLDPITYADYKDVLHEMSQSDLVSIADELGIEIQEYQDYRLIKKTSTVDGVTTTKTVVGINGLLEYQANLYLQANKLKERLDTEKRTFLKQLIDSNCNYQVLEGTDIIEDYLDTKLPENRTSRNPIITTILDFFEKTDPTNKKRKAFFAEWVDKDTGKLILGKQDGRNILTVSDNLDTTKNVELNPFLNTFFYVESLYSTNLRLSFTGFATNHKFDVGATPLYTLKGYTLDQWNKNVGTVYGKLTEAEFTVLHNAEHTGILDTVLDADELGRKIESQKDTLSPKVLTALQTLYRETNNAELCAQELVQLKRNVSITATLQYVTQNHFEGPSEFVRCAAIEDAQAHVYNYRGEVSRNTKDIDANDGLAKITPFQAIMENRALGSQAVGFTKKPIWHDYDTSSGTAFLAKFATNTITNETMKASIKSQASDYRLFKKATNLQWGSEVDLTSSLSQSKTFDDDLVDVGEKETAAQRRKTWFADVILQKGKLFYKNKYGDIIEIVGFGKSISGADTENPQIFYYTEERAKGSDEVVKKYHLFSDVVNADGSVTTSVHSTFNTLPAAVTAVEAFKTNNPDSGLSIHTINSLFELHSALGGIDCVDSKGNGSEFNNEVVVNFMNNIGTWKNTANTKEGAKAVQEGRYPSQATVNQPLKNYHIGYLFNKTSVKEGVKNLNPASSWTDDTVLTTFRVRMAGLGMQMNADHDVIDSELTEFSQVISATAAYGYTFDQTYEIFQGLARTAMQASSQLLTAVDNFIGSLALDENLSPREQETKRLEARTELYDVIGRMMFLNKTQSFRVKPTDIIMESIHKIFNKYSKHDNPEEPKIPFSDPNVYADFLNTLSTTITKDSIKRKHPGSGFVLVGSYDMMQYFEVPDPTTGKSEKLFAPSLIQRAQNEYKAQLLELLNKTHKVNQFDLKALDKIKGIKYEVDPARPWKSDPSKTNQAISIWDEQHPEWGHFELVKDQEFGYYSVHFKTGDKATGTTLSSQTITNPDGTTIVVDDEGRKSRNKLYKALLAVIPDGAYISTWGEVSEGGVKALKRLSTEGNWTSVDTRKVQDLEQKDLEIPIYRKGERVSNPYLGMTLAALEAEALKTLPEMPDYYTQSQDTSIAAEHYITTYLSRRQSLCPTITDRAYFLPSDNVLIRNANGVPIARINFDNDLGKYYNFLDGKLPDGTLIPEDATYQVDVLTPTNLKPSLIRWKAMGADAKAHYHNIFELNVIKQAYQTRSDTSTPAHRKAVQNTLHLLHSGYFIDNEGRQRQIIEGTLENDAAEVVLSNMHKDLFGIGDEQLSEVLKEGVGYFRKQNQSLKAPYHQGYDLAFLKQNGKHTLITIGQARLDESMQLQPFTNITTTADDEIYAVKGNRKLMKIGKWVTVDNVTLNPETQKYEGANVTELNQHLYRQKDGKVQKRVDFITRYNVTIKSTNKNGVVGFNQHTLYQIADVDTIASALDFPANTNADDMERAAVRQQAKLIDTIYKSDNYQMAQINTSYKDITKKHSELKNALQMLTSDDNPIDNDIKELLSFQLNSLTTSTHKNYKRFEELKRHFLEKQAHKRWISFQDSLNYISSRIPAQTLQSFMAMKAVGWTSNSKNMAYVSVFQTYLQGSDYDIDKAYIMSQSYDDNAAYIGWSPYFDFHSTDTLTESKKLPIPKGVVLSFNEDSTTDITAEIKDIIKFFKVDDLNPKYAFLSGTSLKGTNRLKFLQALRNLLVKVERANGLVTCSTEISKNVQDIITNTVKRHENYQIPQNVAEQAYKNLASANIFAVSHDIRNRDQAYTAITMAHAQKVADNSPKGKASASLNMLNPFTKYEMQYQNIVGKQVVGIAANGEKYWFNVYYYWNHVMQTGSKADKERLRFNSVLTRIQGRSKQSSPELKEKLKILCEQRQIQIIPDLDIRSEAIRASLKEVFGMNDESINSMEYKYVDQTISELLSAATDNAKALILAKINAGTNYAKMYLYLVTLGYNLDDIAAFMYSPIAEFIDSRSDENIFDPQQLGKANIAIRAAQGLVSSNFFLHGVLNTTTTSDIEEEDDTVSSAPRYKNRYVKEKLIDILYNPQNKALLDVVVKRLDLGENGTMEENATLDQIMQSIILSVVETPYIVDIEKAFSLMDYKNEFETDREIYSYLRYCQDLVQQLQAVRKQYRETTSTPMEDMLADAEEFNKIYSLASEASSIASAWLGLNQGLPQDKLSMLKRVANMNRTILDREKFLGISRTELFTTSDTEASKAKVAANWEKVFTKIAESNPWADREHIKNVFEQAKNLGIMNNFNVIEMMSNENYKKVAKDYCDIIKGTVNIVDMMDKLPHYKEIMNCFRGLLIADKTLVTKSRLLNKLLSSEQFINQDTLKSIMKYADDLNIMEFLESGQVPIISLETTAEGFDSSFDTAPVDYFDLSRPEGVASFVKWMSHEFLTYLRDNYGDNPLVSHLILLNQDGIVTLAPDIDLLNPDANTASREAFDQMLVGISQFETIQYNPNGNGNLTIADLLQLYNLIINRNVSGGDRLTSLFHVCQNPLGLMSRYYKFIGTRDSSIDFMPDYSWSDYKISAAPVISSSLERFHSEEYIKVKDPVWGTKLRKYHKKSNSYSDYEIVPNFGGNETVEARTQRKINFTKYYPFQMPSRYIYSSFSFSGEVTESVKAALKDTLLNLTRSGKVIVAKIC